MFKEQILINQKKQMIVLFTVVPRLVTPSLSGNLISTVAKAGRGPAEGPWADQGLLYSSVSTLHLLLSSK